jgi:SNF2 family DNA or RNA helicase
MVRRKKEDVLRDLPPKRRYTHCIEIDNRAEYDAAYEEFQAWLIEQYLTRMKYVIGLLHGLQPENPALSRKFRSDLDFVKRMKSLSLPEPELQSQVEDYVLDRVARSLRALVLTKLGKLKQIAARGKLKHVQRYLTQSFKQNPGSKVLCFGWHREIVQSMAKKFNAPLIYGSTGALERFNIVERFQHEPEPRLCVLNLLSGREGLTLTRADKVIFLELGWDAMTHDQAEDRAHRIDPLEQNRREVRCEYFLGKDTIDIPIANFIERKRDLTRLGVQGDTGAAIPEGRINQGCEWNSESGDDVGSFIRSMIQSERDRRSIEIPISSMLSSDVFARLAKSIQDAEVAAQSASRDEEVKLFFMEQEEP